MDMDPLTRQEADNIEGVLADLIADLDLIACLPEEFSLWLRDDAPVIVKRFDEEQLPDLRDAGGVDARYPPGQAGVVEAREELLEELQRLCKASSFLESARQYGDVADTTGNEALLQLTEFSEVERDLLETATTVGHVEEDDIDFHHLSLRALVDTLRDGGYHLRMHELVTDLCPANTSSSSSTSSLGGDDGGDDDADRADNCSQDLFDASASGRRHSRGGAAAHRYNKAGALAADLLSKPVDTFADAMRSLARLVRMRNATTVNEDIHRYKVLHEAVNKEQSATADVQALNREYNIVKVARRKEVAALDEEIDKLEAEIAYLDQAAKKELGNIAEVNEKVRREQESTYRHQLEQHRQAAVALEEKFRQLEAQHIEDAGALRTLRGKREAAVSGAISEYDAQMTLMHTAMRRLQSATEEDTAKIVSLEEQTERLDTERREHEWELQVVEQRQGHLDELRQRQAQGARVLQAYFRAYSARLEVDKAVAAKGKRRKKKKKRATKK